MLKLGEEVDYPLFENKLKRVSAATDLHKKYWRFYEDQLALVEIYEEQNNFQLFGTHFKRIPKDIIAFDFTYHSCHDSLLENAGYPMYSEGRSCIEFKAHDSFLIDKLLENPHYGVACDVLGLQMVEAALDGKANKKSKRCGG